MPLQKHLFFCLNQREDGRQCCAQADSERLWRYMKESLRARGLEDKTKIRVNRCGCLGKCSLGPSLVIYPEAVWYTYRNEEDIDAIIDEHIVAGRVVTHLLMEEI